MREVPKRCKFCGSPSYEIKNVPDCPYNVAFICGVTWYLVPIERWTEERPEACTTIQMLWEIQDTWIRDYGELDAEVQSAIEKFPPFNSPHEGLAIIEEEFLELRAEVFKQYDARTKDAMRQEAIQVAAMAVRFVRDLL